MKMITTYVFRCFLRREPRLFESQGDVKIMKNHNKYNSLGFASVARLLPIVARMLPSGCPLAAGELPVCCPQAAKPLP
jgi:hypothetical protein